MLTFIQYKNLLEPLDCAGVVFVDVMMFSFGNLVAKNGELAARNKFFGSVEIVLKVGVTCAVYSGKIFLLQNLSFPKGIVPLQHCDDV